MERRGMLIWGGMGVLSAAIAGLALMPEPDPFLGYSGMAAPEDPIQTNLAHPVLFFHPAADLVLFAEFSLVALVLSAKRYRKDDLAAVSPLDLALAWGPASHPDSFRDIEYWQTGRWYVYRSRMPIPKEVHRSSSNMHIIPRTATQEEALEGVRKGNLIRMEGHLCDVRIPGLPEIRSSRSREDKDGGACEIVLTSHVEIIA